MSSKPAPTTAAAQPASTLMLVRVWKWLDLFDDCTFFIRAMYYGIFLHEYQLRLFKNHSFIKNFSHNFLGIDDSSLTFRCRLHSPRVTPIMSTQLRS